MSKLMPNNLSFKIQNDKTLIIISLLFSSSIFLFTCPWDTVSDVSRYNLTLCQFSILFIIVIIIIIIAFVNIIHILITPIQWGFILCSVIFNFW